MNHIFKDGNEWKWYYSGQDGEHNDWVKLKTYKIKSTEINSVSHYPKSIQKSMQNISGTKKIYIHQNGEKFQADGKRLLSDKQKLKPPSGE